MYQKIKRLFDIVFSIFSLIILSPIFIIIYFLILINLGKPVFFKQKRPGLEGKPFIIYKFRTMQNYKLSKELNLSDEKRLTSFGKLLRKTSLDELPELYNILINDMSFVGPRPLLMEYLKLYSKKTAKRHNLKPGLTGWAQVNGRNNISWKKKFELDIWYVENISFILDLFILFKTIEKVLKGSGVNKKNEATVDKYNGSN